MINFLLLFCYDRTLLEWVYSVYVVLICISCTINLGECTFYCASVPYKKMDSYICRYLLMQLCVFKSSVQIVWFIMNMGFIVQYKMILKVLLAINLCNESYWRVMIDVWCTIVISLVHMHLIHQTLCFVHQSRSKIPL